MRKLCLLLIAIMAFTLQNTSAQEANERRKLSELPVLLIDNVEAGTLSNRLSDPDNTERLCITGSINGDDINLIRSMACNKLKYLDISGCRIVGITGYYGGVTTSTVSADTKWGNIDDIILYPVGVGNMDNIGKGMFASLTTLETILLPNTVTTIEASAFRDCPNLKSVTIGSATSALSSCCVFTGCSNQLSVTFKSSTYYTIQNNIIYSSNKKTAITALPSVSANVSLLNTVDSIADYAFYDIQKVTSVSMPSGLRLIGQYAFYHTGIYKLSLPQSLTRINNGAFWHCENLSTVTFSSKINYLGYAAFANCNLSTIDLSKTQLTAITGNDSYSNPSARSGRTCYSAFEGNPVTTVYLPATLKTLGRNAFSSTHLTDIYTYATTPPNMYFVHYTPPSPGEILIPNYCLGCTTVNYTSSLTGVDTLTCRVHIPEGTYANYREALGWKAFQANMTPKPSGETTSFSGYNGRTWMVGAWAPIRYDFATINDAMASSLVKDGDILLVDRYYMQGDQTVSKSVKIVGNRSYYFDYWIEGNLNIEAPNVTVDGLIVNGNINVRDEYARIEHSKVYGKILGGFNYECDGAVINSSYVTTIDEGSAEDWTITNNYINGKFSGTLSEYSNYPVDMPYFSEHNLPLTADANSTLVFKYIIANVNSINYMEYFWDTDPGWTKATPLKNSNGNYVTNAWNSPMNISTKGLSTGQHTLVTRARSASGYWVTGVNTINIQSGAVVTDPKPVFSLFDFPVSGVNNDYKISFSVAAEGGLIDWVEYYWDTDPGQKKGHIIVDQGHDSGSGITRSDYLVDCGGLTGKHTLYVRAFCGSESAQVYIKEINLTAPGVVDNAINANDLAALKLISDNLNLNGYWNFANEGRKESDFPGVTFLNHRVIEIDLSNHALTGTLSEKWMPSLPEITLLNLSRNNIYGDVTPLVAKMPKLKTLDVSHNRIMQLTGELPASLTSFNARSQMRTFANSSSGADEMFIDLLVSGAMNPTTAPIGAQVSLALPTLFYYDADKNDNSLHADIQVVDLQSPTTIYGTYTYNGTNKGWKFTPQLDTDMSFEDENLVGLVTTGKWQQWSACPALLSVLLGDANIDGAVDVLDVQHTLNYILATAQPFNYWAANTYVDKTINVQDIVCTVNIMLGLPNNARHGNLARSIDRDVDRPATDTECWVYEQNGRIALVSAADVAALDIEIDGVSTDEVSLLLSHRDFQMIGQNTANGSRYVIFSPTGATVPAAKTASVLALSRSVNPVAVRCADASARELGATISQPTGISEVHSASEGKTVIETHLAPGIYIVRTIDADGNSKTVKILKK